MTREGQLDCVKLLASRGAGLDAKTEVKKLETIIILREIIFVLMLKLRWKKRCKSFCEFS